MGALKPLGQFMLGTSGSPTTIYTAQAQPAGVITKLISIWICNTDNAQRLVTLRARGGGAVNSILNGMPLKVGQSAFIESNILAVILGASESLIGFADVGNVVAVTLSGEEVTASG